MSNIDADFKELVYTRIQALPDGTGLAVGSHGTLDKATILEHVQSGDEIGQKMVEVEKAFFRALKDGTLYEYAI